jgi:hypothetical protein
MTNTLPLPLPLSLPLTRRHPERSAAGAQSKDPVQIHDDVTRGRAPVDEKRLGLRRDQGIHGVLRLRRCAPPLRMTRCRSVRPRTQAWNASFHDAAGDGGIYTG